MLLILDNSMYKNDELAYIKYVKKTLKKLKIPFHIVSKIENIEYLFEKIKGIIITGSSLKMSHAGIDYPLDILDFNIYYINKLNVPVYGICFGCQLLNIIFNGKLIDNKEYICEELPFYKVDKNYLLFENINTTNKFNYCFSDLVIPSKKTISYASIKVDNKEYKVAFEFKKNKIFGTLFHPELKNDTQQVYLNFYNLCNK